MHNLHYCVWIQLDVQMCAHLNKTTLFFIVITLQYFLLQMAISGGATGDAHD